MSNNSHTTSHPTTTHTITSKDGTPIQVQTLGAGPSLIVVPGAMSSAEDYLVFADAMAASHTVHVMDRRGHGGSGPMGPDYCIGKEVEDVTAVQRHTGAESIFGHSYGGLVALESARCNEGLKKLAVFEPGVSIDRSIPIDWMPAYEAHLAAGHPLDAFTVFVIAMGPGSKWIPVWLMRPMLKAMFKGDKWEHMVPMLPANLIEHQEVGRLDNSYPNYREISAASLLMAGERSPASGRQTLATLARTIPDARVEIVPKLDHFGPTDGGPAIVAQQVRAFLS